jgi:hypothetical protein
VAGAGFGFGEPNARGGQLPMRASNVGDDRELLAGEAVDHSLAAGGTGVEAVRVKSHEPALADG